MKKFTCSFMASLVCSLICAQDLYFTNPGQSLIYLNPSYAGSNGGIRNQSAYRNHWPNASPSFNTYINAFDAYVPDIKGGISVTALKDDQGAGTLVTGAINLGYAQYFSVADGKVKLVPSIQAGYFQMRLDLTKLNFGDAINARHNLYWNDNGFVQSWGPGLPGSYKSNVNFGSGLVMHCRNLSAGVAVFNFTQPDIGLYGLYKLPLRTCAHAAYTIPINDDMFVTVNGVYNNQFRANRWQVSPVLSYKKLFVGAGMSDEFAGSANHRQSLLLLCGIHLKKMNLAYSFDAPAARVTGRVWNSHELSLSFCFKSKKDSVSKVGVEYW